MCKIVFVNRYFYPDHSATSQILADVAFDLSRYGYRVEVISSSHRYGVSSRKSDLAKSEVISGVAVHRCGSSSFGRSSIFSRIFDYVTFYILASLKVFIIVRRGDVVVAMTDPPLMGLWLRPFVSLRHGKLVNWLQDIFPEISEGLRVPVLPASVAKLLRWARNKSCNGASFNVVIGERMSDYLQSGGVLGEKIAVINNWAPVEIASGSDGSDELRHRTPFVVGYSGNLGLAHEWFTILHAAEKLKLRSDILFDVVGGGAGFEQFRSEVFARGLPNVRFRPYERIDQARKSLLSMDLHLISLLPQISSYLVPSKVYGILAVGRPFVYIGSHESEIAEIAAKGGSGLQVDVGDTDGLVCHILGLSGDRERLRRMGIAGKLQHDNHYSREFAIKSWIKVLEDQGISSTKECS